MYKEWRTAGEVGAWLYEERLADFLTHLGHVVGYASDDLDWAAISHGLSITDSDRGQWYDYVFEGRRLLRFALAHDEPGTGIVTVRIRLEGLDDFERGQLAILVELMQ